MGRGIVVLFMLDTSSSGANCLFYVLSNKGVVPQLMLLEHGILVL